MIFSPQDQHQGDASQDRKGSYLVVLRARLLVQLQWIQL